MAFFILTFEEARTVILKEFSWYFDQIDDTRRTFRIYLTFRTVDKYMLSKFRKSAQGPTENFYLKLFSTVCVLTLLQTH